MLTDKGYTPTSRIWAPGKVKTNIFLVKSHKNLTGGFVPPDDISSEIELIGYEIELRGYKKDIKNLCDSTPK